MPLYPPDDDNNWQVDVDDPTIVDQLYLRNIAAYGSTPLSKLRIIARYYLILSTHYIRDAVAYLIIPGIVLIIISLVISIFT